MSSTPRFVYFRRARFRLTLYYTLIMLAFFTALCWFLHYRMERTLFKQLDTFLAFHGESVMEYVYDHPPPEHKNAILSTFNLKQRGQRFYDVTFRLLDPSGNILVASEIFDNEHIGAIKPDVLDAAINDGDTIEYLQLPGRLSSHYLLTIAFKERGSSRVAYILQELAYLEPLDALTERFRHNIYQTVPVFLLFSMLSGYALARKVLKPVHVISHTARRLTSAKLNQRLIRTNSGDEFDMLAATLNDMLSRLQQSFEVLRQFAADAAHELRTPLTILKGEAEIALRSDTKDPETYRDTLASCIRESDRMIGIITHLLLLSQADRGDVLLEDKPFRLDELLTDLVETFQVIAEVNSLTLEAGEFPEIVVRGDGLRLHELFANLLDNACKYTPAGGAVSLRAVVGEDEVCVSVSDTGIGIPEEERERIFDRFYRVDRSRSRETGGSGLGLSIVRWIAKAHDGQIEVTGALGEGSTFTVRLPLAHARGDDEPEDTSEEAPTEEAPPVSTQM
ncbi:HAMP domain-containing protein [bacterium]|nr:HAMP domain-containing protein [bacterium]